MRLNSNITFEESMLQYIALPRTTDVQILLDNGPIQQQFVLPIVQEGGI
jgi:hypothetical protein